MLSTSDRTEQGFCRKLQILKILIVFLIFNSKILIVFLNISYLKKCLILYFG